MNDPLGRITDLAEATVVDPGPSVDELTDRVRRRRRRRTGVVAGTLAVLALGVGVAVRPPDESTVATVAAPTPAEVVPDFAEDDAAWREVRIDGVVDRDGEPAPVYRRDGDAGLVLVLGESIPCGSVDTCTAERPEPPDDVGLLDTAGPFGDHTVVYVPSWTDDLHLGRNPDGRLPGVDARLRFVGADNVDRVVETLADDPATADGDVVLVGEGGGGIGALAHASTVHDAFPDRGLVVLVDGMIVPGRDSVGPCLDGVARRLWRAEVSTAGDRAAEVQRRLAEQVPEARFVVTVFERDPWLQRFLGVGRACDRGADPVDAATLAEAVDASDTGVPGWRVLRLPGTGHRVLDRPVGDALATRVAQALEAEGR